MTAYALGPAPGTPFPAADTTPFQRKSGPALPAGRVHAVHRRYSLLSSARLRLFLLVGCFILAASVALLIIGCSDAMVFERRTSWHIEPQSRWRWPWFGADSRQDYES